MCGIMRDLSHIITALSDVSTKVSFCESDPNGSGAALTRATITSVPERLVHSFGAAEMVATPVRHHNGWYRNT
jgi:hypothetical protein